MKFILTITMFSLLFGFSAEAQKLGHVNSQEILLAMPETNQMQTALGNKEKDYAGQLEGMYKEYETKATELEQRGSQLSQAILEAKTQDLLDLQKRIQKFEVDAQDELIKLQDQLKQPILEKARVAIQSVAKTNGYTYVFDTSSGVVLHFPATDDLTAQVKSSLGIN